MLHHNFLNDVSAVKTVNNAWCFISYLFFYCWRKRTFPFYSFRSCQNVQYQRQRKVPPLPRNEAHFVWESYLRQETEFNCIKARERETDQQHWEWRLDSVLAPCWSGIDSPHCPRAAPGRCGGSRTLRRGRAGWPPPSVWGRSWTRSLPLTGLTYHSTAARTP